MLQFEILDFTLIWVIFTWITVWLLAQQFGQCHSPNQWPNGRLWMTAFWMTWLLKSCQFVKEFTTSFTRVNQTKHSCDKSKRWRFAPSFNIYDNPVQFIILILYCDLSKILQYILGSILRQNGYSKQKIDGVAKNASTLGKTRLCVRKHNCTIIGNRLLIFCQLDIGD